jgi:D,D-heptose 1,7-bisphosphate phosphatase
MTEKAIFLDRDGTIIVERAYISKEEEVKLLEGAAEGIKLLKKLGFMVIVITNQSGIARGFFTIEDFEKVNQRMLELLRIKGADLDGIYFCPHLKGGIVSKYNIECECRKPKPGLIFKAVVKHNISLAKSFLIGDDIKDLLAGKNAGMRTILVLTGYGREAIKDKGTLLFADYVAKNLAEAAEWIGGGL